MKVCLNRQGVILQVQIGYQYCLPYGELVFSSLYILQLLCKSSLFKAPYSKRDVCFFDYSWINRLDPTTGGIFRSLSRGEKFLLNYFRFMLRSISFFQKVFILTGKRPCYTFSRNYFNQFDPFFSDYVSSASNRVRN